jgi:hypothetical protein
MHDMQNMQTSFPICRICTAHFADEIEATLYKTPLWHEIAPRFFLQEQIKTRYVPFSI